MALIYLAEIGCYIQGASSSSVTVGGAGDKTFVLDAAVAFVVGMTVTADAGSGNTITGTVASYTALTKMLVVAASGSAGSGSHSSWTIGGTTTLRYATGAGYNAASAPGWYDPRIQQPASFAQYLVAPGRTFGDSRAGAGALVLLNPDGVLDGLIDYGFDGRSFVLLLGDDAGAYGSFAAVLTGTVEQPEFDFARVTLRLRDRQAETDVPLQPAKYAGTNSGSTGVEGLPADLQGKPKVRCWGECYNVAPPAENTSALIYGLNHDSAGSDAPVNAVTAVRVGGAAWSLDTAVGTSGDAANLAALQAASITTGQYATCLAAGKIRLGSDPGAAVTVDLQGDKRGGTYRYKAADLANELLVQVAGIDSGDVASADVAALNTANSAAVGFWSDGETTVQAALDQVLGAVGATWWVDADGSFRMARLEAPAGSPAATFKRFVLDAAAASTDADIVAIERLAATDPTAGLPVQRVNLSYRRHWLVQTADGLVGIAAATGQPYTREWRTATSADATVAVLHALAPSLDLESLLTDATAAATEAARLQALYGTRRDRYRVTAYVSAALAASAVLGGVVQLELPRFGLDAGKLFVVTGRTWDARARRIVLDLWG